MFRGMQELKFYLSNVCKVFGDEAGEVGESRDRDSGTGVSST